MAGRSPLVLLHAWPLDARMWQDQGLALGPEGPVLAPDLPGFGNEPLTPQPSLGRLGATSFRLPARQRHPKRGASRVLHGRPGERRAARVLERGRRLTFARPIFLTGASSTMRPTHR